MENMDRRLTVPKWVLMNWPKIPQMPPNLSAQIVCLSPKVWDFDEKKLHWASVLRATCHYMVCHLQRFDYACFILLKRNLLVIYL